MKNVRRVMALVLTALMLIVGMVDVTPSQAAKKNAKKTPLTTNWTSGSTVAKSLRNYVKKVTNAKDKANYIPRRTASPLLIWTEHLHVRRTLHIMIR